MADIYSFDSAVAGDAEGGLAATIAAPEASLGDLTGFVNTVCANWEGDEQGIYRGIQTRWDNAAGQMRDIITQVKTAFGSTTESVDTMRARVRQNLGG
jgi:uncharacterized protein YukE